MFLEKCRCVPKMSFPEIRKSEKAFTEGFAKRTLRSTFSVTHFRKIHLVDEIHFLENWSFGNVDGAGPGEGPITAPLRS